MNENMSTKDRLEKLITENRKFGEGLEEEIARLYVNEKEISKEDMDYLLGFNQGLDKEKLDSLINRNLQEQGELQKAQVKINSSSNPARTKEEIALDLYKKGEIDEDTLNFLYNNGTLRKGIVENMMKEENNTNNAVEQNPEAKVNEEIKQEEAPTNEIDEHIKGIQEHKDEISNAVYNSDFSALADLYNKNILNDNDLKILSETSETKVDGEQTKDLYNEVKSIAESVKQSDQNLSDLFKNNASILEENKPEALQQPEGVIPPVGRDIIEEDNSRLKINPTDFQNFNNGNDNNNYNTEPTTPDNTKVKDFMKEAEEYKRKKEELKRRQQQANNNPTNDDNSSKHPLHAFMNDYIAVELENLKQNKGMIIPNSNKQTEEEIIAKLDVVNSEIEQLEAENEKIDEKNNEIKRELDATKKAFDVDFFEKMSELNADERESSDKAEALKEQRNKDIERFENLSAEYKQMFNEYSSNLTKKALLEQDRKKYEKELENINTSENTNDNYNDRRSEVLTELKAGIEELERREFPNLSHASEYLEAKQANGVEAEDLKRIFKEDVQATKQVYDLLNEEQLLLIGRKTELENFLNSNTNNNNEEVKSPKLVAVEKQIEEEIKDLTNKKGEEIYSAIANLATLVKERETVKNQTMSTSNNENDALRKQAEEEIREIDQKISKIKKVTEMVNYPELFNKIDDRENFSEEFDNVLPPFIVTKYYDAEFYQKQLEDFEKTHNMDSAEAYKDIVDIRYDEYGFFAKDEEVNVNRFMNKYNLTLEEVYQYKDLNVNVNAAKNASDNEYDKDIEKAVESGKINRKVKKQIKQSLEDKDMIRLLNIPLVDENGKERESIPELRNLADEYEISPYVLYSFAKSKSKKRGGPIPVVEERTLGEKAKGFLKRHWKGIAAVTVTVGVLITALVRCNSDNDKDPREAAKDAMDADNALKQEQEVNTEDKDLSTGEEVNSVEVGGQTYGMGGSDSYGSSNNVVHVNNGEDTEIREDYDGSYDTPPIDETDPNQPTTPEDPDDPEISVDLPYLEEGGYWQMKDGLISYDGTVTYTGADGKTYTAKLSPEYFTYVDGKMYLTQDAFDALSNNGASIVDTVNKGGIVLDDVKEVEQNDNTNSGQVNDNTNNSNNNTNTGNTTNTNESVFVEPAPSTPGVGEDVYPATPIISEKDENTQTGNTNNNQNVNDNTQTSEENYDPTLPKSDDPDAIKSVLEGLNKAQTPEVTSVEESEKKITDIQSDLDKLKEERAKALKQQQINEADVAAMNTEKIR